MLSMVKMQLKGKVGGLALYSHGSYIVDHGKIIEKLWNGVFEFMWEPSYGIPFQCILSLFSPVLTVDICSMSAYVLTWPILQTIWTKIRLLHGFTHFTVHFYWPQPKIES